MEKVLPVQTGKKKNKFYVLQKEYVYIYIYITEILIIALDCYR